MSLLRVFIAIEIPHRIQSKILKNTSDLRSSLDHSLVKWVPESNLHLTLKFLGDTSRANVDILTRILSVEASRHSEFELQVGELGIFPNVQRPRVVWVGIQAPDALASLQHGIEAATAKMGYPAEKRPFSPHLTIGRVKQKITATDQHKVRTAFQAAKLGMLGTTYVDAVHLYKSDLKPSGAIYTRLATAPLKKNSPNPDNHSEVITERS